MNADDYVARKLLSRKPCTASVLLHYIWHHMGLSTTLKSFLKLELSAQPGVTFLTLYHWYDWRWDEYKWDYSKLMMQEDNVSRYVIQIQTNKQKKPVSGGFALGRLWVTTENPSFFVPKKQRHCHLANFQIILALHE